MTDWIYIYRVSGDALTYITTVSRTGLGPARAAQIVAEFRARGVEAFYTIGCRPDAKTFV